MKKLITQLFGNTVKVVKQVPKPYCHNAAVQAMNAGQELQDLYRM